MAEPIRQKRCASCGASFECGAALAGQGGGCWCSELPPLTVRTGSDCLCPVCLAEAIRMQLHTENDL